MLKINKKEFIKKYKSMPIQELANELGVTKQAIYYILRKNNIPKKGNRARKVILLD